MNHSRFDIKRLLCIDCALAVEMANVGRENVSRHLFLESSRVRFLESYRLLFPESSRDDNISQQILQPSRTRAPAPYMPQGVWGLQTLTHGWAYRISLVIYPYCRSSPIPVQWGSDLQGLRGCPPG
ncbi:hypothetical protein SKAU_G00322020 [Synaphobranchus kaupii]|uniref:Uncharacterized protein n=1 Tax=Synaphobranchus kaupii TaxID=118154 RepID=A0A9Q1ENY2_SYNKA|nr:hypothetical protein SKAU_G00322020 [Synaphobranchus kaupii]